MPKPSATTDACKRNLASALLSAANGCRNASPKISPEHRAIGGEINPVALKISSKKKIVLVFIPSGRRRNARPASQSCA
jgi:hypothetical protein